MRTVVQVSPAEVVRMVAMLVMQRPENLGRCSGAVEMHNGPQGITEIRVVTFDTLEEAVGYTREVEAAAAARPAHGAVFELVPGGKGAAPPAADVPGAP